MMEDNLWEQYQELEPERTSFWSTFTKPRRLGFLEMPEAALRAFGPGERLTLYLLVIIAGLSALLLVSGVNALASVDIPTAGGSITEGELGPARFINPLLAISQADQDLSALVYSGLMRAKPDGSLIPDLAQSYTISSDGRTYTFKLRPNATFQDGTKVTSADVVFTVGEAVNPEIDSPHRADWTGVEVSAPDPSTVVFTLPHAYAPFLFNTTLGILPKARWSGIPTEEFRFSPFNTRPIGSGPYKTENVTNDATGAPKRYDLSPFASFVLGAPHVARISFVFYPDTPSLMKGLNNHEIDAAAGISPEDLASVKRTDLFVAQQPLPRIYGVFFNQSHNPLLQDEAVRHALEAAVDKKAIVQSVLLGRGEVLNGPIPPGTIGDSALAQPSPLASATSTASSSVPEASDTKDLLQQAGWTFFPASSTPAGVTGAKAIGSWSKKIDGKTQTLSFTIATADQPALVATAKQMVLAWQSFGIDVTLQIYPLSDLNTTVIRPRNYDALLFGEIVGPQLDLYAFWHSSQRNDPGLNLALYANPKTDTLLSEARATTDDATRNSLYQQFAVALAKDHPAIFLYAPDFLYLVPQNLRGLQLGSLADASDRFNNVYEWYTDTERVWRYLAPKTLPNY